MSFPATNDWVVPALNDIQDACRPPDSMMAQTLSRGPLLLCSRPAALALSSHRQPR